MNRYFLVSYTAFDKKGRTYKGCTEVMAQDNSYFNKKGLFDELEKTQEYVKVIIQNIIELEEKDYLDYIKR